MMPRTEPSPGDFLRSRLAALRRRRLAIDIPALLLLAAGLLAAGVAVVALMFWSGWLLLALLPGFGYVAWRWLAGLSRRELAYAVEAEYAGGPEPQRHRADGVLTTDKHGYGRDMARTGRGQKTEPQRHRADGKGIQVKSQKPKAKSQNQRTDDGEPQRHGADKDDSPVMAGRLVAALDLSDQAPAREAYSADLRRAAVQAVEADLRGVDPGRLCRPRRLLWAGLVFALGIGLVIAGRSGFPGRFEVGLVNAFARDRLAIGFEVAPGDTAVLPGTELELVCRVEPAGIFRTVSLIQPGRRPKRLRLEDGVARMPLYAARDQAYRFRVLGAVSDQYRVRLLEPLSIERLEFTLRPPAYTGLPESRVSGPDLAGLVGSELLIEGRASQEFEAGRLAFAEDTVELEPGPDGRFSGRFTVRREDRGEFELQPESGGAYQRCGLIFVRAMPDETPLVRILRPGRDVDLPMSMQLPLLINSLDDYGLGALWLRWGRDSLDQRVRIRSLAGKREDTTLYVWDLSELGLLPGDLVRYRVEVTDNDVVSGPKTGRTEIFAVRFPTMGEIFSASVRQTEHTREELEPLRELQERLTEEVGRLGKQARGAGELSWEERQALGELLTEQQNLASELSHLHEQVQELLDNIYEGVAFDEETVRRLTELQQLLSDLLPRDLAESLERLREKLDESGPELRQALERFELDQEEFRRSLDAALEFLRQVMDEQRLEALARTAEELARTEQEIAERALSDPSEALAREQAALADELDRMLSELAELAEQMSDQATADALAELAEAAAQDRLGEAAREAADRFEAGQAGAAGQQAAQLAGQLSELGQSLSGLSSELKQRRSSEVAGRLIAAVEELLMLSREQEELAARVRPGAGGFEPQRHRADGIFTTDKHGYGRDMARTGRGQGTEPQRYGAGRDGIGQDSAGGAESGPAIARGMAIHDATGVIAESLAALSGRTMAIPGRLVGELGRARGLMHSAGQDLLEARAGRAADQMVQARAALDRVAAGLLEALSEAEQGGGMSGGFAGLMEALSQLAAGQMAVNIGMGGMPIPMPGGMSPGLAEALSRLMAQQGALREQLEQLLQELGGQRPGLTSALDGVLEEMREVERDMAEFNIERELIERQEGILSRLLDAQRSIRQRGHKEEREAETAGEFLRETVPALPEDRGERNRLLREELMRALREGRLGRFEPQVRAYFEQLLRETQER